MVVTHFVLAGRGITGAIVTVGGVTVGGEVVGGASIVVVVVVVERLSVSGATGLVSVVWISARRARAVLSLSRICSISS